MCLYVVSLSYQCGSLDSSYAVFLELEMRSYIRCLSSHALMLFLAGLSHVFYVNFVILRFL